LTSIWYGKAWPPKKKCINHFCEKAKTRFEKPLWRIICIMQWIFLGDLTHTYVRTLISTLETKKIVKSNFGFVLWAGHLRCCKERWKNQHFLFCKKSMHNTWGRGQGGGGLKVVPYIWKTLMIVPSYPKD
jgi:hypothetical protein